MDRAGFDDGRAGLDVEIQDPVQVAAEVENDAGPDGVTGDGRAGAARRKGNTAFTADLQRSEDFVQVSRKNDSRRLHPVQRRIA